MARYIDADLLSEQVNNAYIDGDSPLSYHASSEGDTLIGKFQVLDLIYDLPTADVAEVKHGKWAVRHRHEHYPSCKPYDENVCPFCRRADHNGDGMYCGYCGAKMDGKEGV